MCLQVYLSIFSVFSFQLPFFCFAPFFPLPVLSCIAEVIFCFTFSLFIWNFLFISFLVTNNLNIWNLWVMIFLSHHPPKFAQVHIHCISDATSHLISWCPLLFLPLVFHSIRDFSNISIPWFLFTFRSWLFQWIKFQHDFKIICTISSPVELNSWRIYSRISTNGLNWKLFLQTSDEL